MQGIRRKVTSFEYGFSAPQKKGERNESFYTSVLLDKCSSLYGYAYFVATVRKYLEDMDLTEAVNTAVEECIRADILKEFLMEHKAEVVAMSIYEYNEEYVRKSLFEDGMETGYNKGHQIGEARKLVQIVESAMPNFENSLELTCEKLNVTMEEYQQAKAFMIKEQKQS